MAMNACLLSATSVKPNAGASHVFLSFANVNHANNCLLRILHSISCDSQDMSGTWCDALDLKGGVNLVCFAKGETTAGKSLNSGPFGKLRIYV